MIKNIPNKYTQKMLLATIDEEFRGHYDFFYLPIDFKNKCNVGYAFINMVSRYKQICSSPGTPTHKSFNLWIPACMREGLTCGCSLTTGHPGFPSGSLWRWTVQGASVASFAHFTSTEVSKAMWLVCALGSRFLA